VQPQSHAAAVAVAADASGHVYVAGWTSPMLSSAGPFQLLMRFDASGNREWVRTLPGDVLGGARPADLVADPGGRVYLVGGVTILAFDSAGTPLWSRQIGDPTSTWIESVTVDPSEALYVAGHTARALAGQTALGDEDAFLQKWLPPTLATAHYEIVARHSGKCLDVSAASTTLASVIQWTCHGGANQQWRLEPVENGAYRIVARHSGLVLDVYGALTEDVAPLIQYPWHGGTNQLWTIASDTGDYVRIVARHSGKVLDVEGASIDEGARVIQYSEHGNANQQWLLRVVPGP
jgi:hypothetical protein